jgi:hypothetical protein
MANLGTIPVKIENITFAFTGGNPALLKYLTFGNWTLSGGNFPAGGEPGVGLPALRNALSYWQIEPNQIITLTIEFYFIEETADGKIMPQNENVSFTITITAVQWNEAGNGDGGKVFVPFSLMGMGHPPVINEPSNRIDIFNSTGMAWGWQNDIPSPLDYRPAPYMLVGDRLHVELDVADAGNDLKNMTVQVNIGPAVSFLCPWVGDLGLVNEIPTAHYAGDWLVDNATIQGIFDFSVTATDHGGLSDSYNPELYKGGDVLVKPDMTVVVNPPNIAFPTTQPGTSVLSGKGNPYNVTGEALINGTHVPVLFTILHSSTDMISSNGTIPGNCISWSLSNNSAGAAALQTAPLTPLTPNEVPEGASIPVYYWLNVPAGQATGQYSGKINYDFIAR